MPILLFVAISALVGGGASVAAESSLPGDILYPVKVNVNESVRAWFALSAEAKANLDSKFAIKRLEEAEKLSVKGRFDPDVRANLEARFEAYADRVVSRLADLEAENNVSAAAGVSSNFESSLSSHERIMIQMAASKPTLHSQINLMLGGVRSKINSSAAIRARTEANLSAGTEVSVKLGAEGRLRASMNKIAEVRKFIETRGSSISTEAKAQAEAKLTLAEGRIASGKISLEAGAYADAFIAFQEAHRLAQDAKLTIEVRTNLIRIESSSNIDSSAGGNTDVEVGAGVNSSGGNTNVEGEVEVQIGF